MGQYSKTDWYKERVATLLEQYGAVPPPWTYAENSHPYSMRWRMGDGETHIMVWSEWLEQQHWTEMQRVEYFRKWPAPPRWMGWMAEAIWDLKPWDCEGEFNYEPYFKKLTDLGFDGAANHENDLADEKWLDAES